MNNTNTVVWLSNEVIRFTHWAWLSSIEYPIWVLRENTPPKIGDVITIKKEKPKRRPSRVKACHSSLDMPGL